MNEPLREPIRTNKGLINFIRNHVQLSPSPTQIRAALKLVSSKRNLLIPHPEWPRKRRREWARLVTKGTY